MAHPDRHIGKREQPGEFTAIVQGLFDARELRSLDAELHGLRGPLEKEVAQWHKEGLGRIIAAPIPEVVGDKVPGGRYRTMAYALPVTDDSVSGHERRALLLFAAEEGPHTVIMIGPRKSEKSDDIQASENEHFISDFDLLVRPSDKPSIIAGWDPQPGEKPFQSFDNNLSLFPSIVCYPLKSGNTDPIFKEAVANARRMKVRGIHTDEDTLRAKLDLEPEVTAVLEIIHNDWEHLRRDEQAGTFRTLFSDKDSGESKAA